MQKLKTNLALKASEKAWTQAAVMVINTLYEAPQSLTREDSNKCFTELGSAPRLANGEAALRMLQGKVHRVLNHMGQWRTPALKSGDRFFWSGEDLRAAF